MKTAEKLGKFLLQAPHYGGWIKYFIIHFVRVYWNQDSGYKNNGYDNYYFNKTPCYFYGTIRERNEFLKRICGHYEK